MGDLGAESVESVYNENKLLAELTHPFITRLFEVIDTSAVLYIVMDLASRVGSKSAALRQLTSPRLCSKKMARKIMGNVQSIWRFARN